MDSYRSTNTTSPNYASGYIEIPPMNVYIPSGDIAYYCSKCNIYRSIRPDLYEIFASLHNIQHVIDDIRKELEDIKSKINVA